MQEMKTINKFLYALATLSIMAGCQAAVEPVAPGEPDVAGCEGVYFPAQDLSAYAYLSPEAPCVAEISVARKNAGTAITVPVKMTANVEDVFVMSEVSFAADETETSFTLTFDKSEVGVPYKVTFSVDDPQYASVYGSGNTYLDFNTMRVEWKYVMTEDGSEKAKFTFVQDWWEEEHTGYVKYYEIDNVRYCETETDPMDYGDGIGTGFFGLDDGELSFNWYLNVRTSDKKQAVWLKPHRLGDASVANPSYAGFDLMMWDWWSWWTISNPQAVFEGKEFADFVADYSDKYPVSYYDNGGFYFHTAYYYMEGLGGWSQDYVEVVCEADGYTRIDYTLEMETDYSAEGILPLYFEAGADVAEIKVAGAAGSLSNAAVGKLAASIVAGETEAASVDMTEEDLSLGLEFEETGMYTIVAVAFNEDGEDVATASLTAFYVAADDEEYDVKIDCGTEAVPERYQADEYRSFAYWIAGEDITEAHVAVVPAANIKSIYATAEEVKLDEEEEYALDEEAIAAINAKGGYYAVAEGLAPGTDYVLVVWATNGSLDTFVTAEYSTPELPYVWKSLGTGEWTDALVSDLFSVPTVTVPCEVFEEESHPGLYKMSGYALHLIAALFETTDEEMEPYSGNWHEAEIVIDATDPTKVVMEFQDYGICMNSSYGFISIGNMYEGELTDYGTLENNEITFGDMYFNMAKYGGWKDMNETRGTKLVLPAGVQPSSLTKNNGGERRDFNSIQFLGADRKVVARPSYSRDEVSAASIKVAPVASATRAVSNRYSEINKF